MPSTTVSDVPELLAAGTSLEIDLDALRENYRSLKAIAAPAECSAAVKANAYGIGATEAVKALSEAGCRTFFVALLREAHEVLEAAPGSTVYVLNGIEPGTASAYAHAGIRPVLGNMEEVREWAGCCNALGNRLAAALHIDTGINRLGLEPNEVEQLVADPALRESFETSLVMSHLACADDAQSQMTEQQRETFTSFLPHFPDVPASLANTAGIMRGNAFHFDLVRPGIGLYGGRAVSEGVNPMQPVAYLNGQILQVRTVMRGETVGYGATWTAQRDSRVAIVGVGYADGYFRILSGTNTKTVAHVYLGGQYAPVIGRVSMDMITIDVTDIEPGQAGRGTMVELLGRNITVDDLADAAGTIGFEVLTSLGSRYARVYSRA